MVKIILSLLIAYNSLQYTSAEDTDGNQDWLVKEDWTALPGGYRFVAESTEIVEQCKENPSHYLETPMVLHTFQELHGDNHLIGYHNDQKTVRVDTFATSIVIKCTQLTGYKKIRWTIDSSNSFFRRFPHYPHVTHSVPTTAAWTRIVFAGSAVSIILICLHSLLIFIGKLRHRFVISYLLSGFFLTCFTALAVPSYWGFDLDYIHHYKLFTGFIVLSGIAVLDLLVQSQLLSKKLFWFVSSILGISLFSIVVSDNTELIQGAINLAYLAYCPTVLWVTLKAFKRLLSKRTGIEFLNFVSVVCFSMFLSHDMLLVPGFISGTMICPLGFVSFFFFQGCYLQQTIDSVYNERDQYRDNLKKSYQEKIELLQRSAVSLAIANTTQMIAHDLKKPFSLLKLIISQISLPNPPHDLIKRLFLHVQDSAHYVDNLISDLLISGNLSSNKLEPALLTELYDLAWQQQALGRSRQFDLSVNIDSCSRLLIDKMKVVRLLANLFGNAMDAMPDIHNKIWLTAKDVTQNGQTYTEITVGNEGSYIDELCIGEIFSKFYTSNKAHGTGLGLAICLEIVRSHGGSIHCTSDPNRGTEFIFTLPVDSTPLHHLKT